MTALSPGFSWLVIVGLLAVVAVIYVYLVGSEWLDRSERELDRNRRPMTQTWADPADPNIRILAGPHDWESSGDFLDDDDPDLARWVWDENEWKGSP